MVSQIGHCLLLVLIAIASWIFNIGNWIFIVIVGRTQLKIQAALLELLFYFQEK